MCITDAQIEALQLRITGVIQPAALSAHDLGDIIAAYEDALAAIATRQHPITRPEDITVGLVGVEQGSVALQFASPLPDVVVPAAIRLTKAIQTNNWADLPLRALNAVRTLAKLAAQRDWAVHFLTYDRSTTVSAVITKDTHIPPAVSLYGQTEIIAEVKRVGGVEPRVMLRTLQGETLYCTTTEETARQLGAHLYEQVKLSGAAEWNLESLAIVEFDIAAILPYHRASPTEAFDALRHEFGRFFDSIDNPDAWAVEVRHGKRP